MNSSWMHGWRLRLVNERRKWTTLTPLSRLKDGRQPHLSLRQFPLSLVIKRSRKLPALLARHLPAGINHVQCIPERQTRTNSKVASSISEFRAPVIFANDGHPERRKFKVSIVKNRLFIAETVWCIHRRPQMRQKHRVPPMEDAAQEYLTVISRAAGHFV